MLQCTALGEGLVNYNYNLLQVAGGRNVAPALLKVAMKSIEDSRQMRYQSINAYRKRFNMKPYKSFEEMTGEG